MGLVPALVEELRDVSERRRLLVDVDRPRGEEAVVGAGHRRQPGIDAVPHPLVVIRHERRRGDEPEVVHGLARDRGEGAPAERDRHRGLDVNLARLRHVQPEVDEDRRRRAAAIDDLEVVEVARREAPHRDLRRSGRVARYVGMGLDQLGRQPDLDGKLLEQELDAAVADGGEEAREPPRGAVRPDPQLDVGHRDDHERPPVRIAEEARAGVDRQLRLDGDPIREGAGANVLHAHAVVQRREPDGGARRDSDLVTGVLPHDRRRPGGREVAEQVEERLPRRRHQLPPTELVGSMIPS